MAVLQLLLTVPTVVLHQRPLLCARRALRRAGPLAASVQTASGWRLAAGTASVQTFDLESTRDSTEGATLPGLTGADALTPAWMAHALARVHAHDYSCIARGQVFVAPSWLPGELLPRCSRTSPHCRSAACSSRTTIAAWPGCTPRTGPRSTASHRPVRRAPHCPSSSRRSISSSRQWWAGMFLQVPPSRPPMA